MKDYISVGLLGSGTVGGGVIKLLEKNAEMITRKVGKEIKLTKIFGRNIEKMSAAYGDAYEYTTNVDDVLNDPEAFARYQKVQDQLGSSLQRLLAVTESYPELKANENFKELQEQLAQTEDKIAYSRQFYNDTVLMYNNKCQTFPSNIFAGMFGFKEADFFEAAGEARSVPKVEF